MKLRKVFVHLFHRGNHVALPSLESRKQAEDLYGLELSRMDRRYERVHGNTRLRKRGLGKKRSLALREFALGIEGLERFVRGEPLRRVHECVFAVLALESEPVDPRL